jgi:hypothetical protein
VRPLRYIWAFPTTALGLLPAAAAVLTGGRWRIVDGVLEAHGSLLDWLLRNCVPIKGGAEAMTLGHVILGRNERSLEVTRRHEHAHVRQCEQWGPVFVPAYLTSAVILIVSGKDGYRDNYFERDARANEERAEV